MPTKRTPTGTSNIELPPPAKTLQGRTDQLIAAAYDLAERRILEGTASAQEVVHFLKQGSPREQLEMKKLTAENEVLKTRVKEMESRKSGEELLGQALAAFRGYAGIDPINQDSNEDPDLY